MPQLAEKWDMAPDGKSWTITLRKGVKFHENWGEFTAKDVRHSIFLITQPESVQTDAGLWRTLMGIEKADSLDEVAKKVTQMVEIVNDHTVIIRTKIVTPELVDNLSANTDLVMESKARWDAGGRSCTARKWWGPAPLSSWNARWAHMCSTSVWKTTGARRRHTKSWSSAGCQRT